MGRFQVSSSPQKGAVLVATMLLSMLATAGVLLSTASGGLLRATEVSREVERERTMAIAEAGIDAVQVLLNANAWTPTSVLDWSSDGIDNDDDGLIDEADESLRATTLMWASDGIDNDRDGAIDEADERVVRVTSTARLGRTTCKVTGWLARRGGRLVTPPEVAYLIDLEGEEPANGDPSPKTP